MPAYAGEVNGDNKKDFWRGAKTNKSDGEYKTAMGLLYGIAFTIKMRYKGNHKKKNIKEGKDTNGIYT